MIETNISLFLCLLVAIHIFLQPSRQCCLLFKEEGIYWNVLATWICAFLFLLWILEVWLAALKVDVHDAVYQPS